METNQLPPAFQEILILKADRLCADTLRHLSLQVSPGANIRLAGSLERASRLLLATPVDLLIIGTEPISDGDTLDFIARCTANHSPARQVLIVTTQCEDRVLAALRTLPVYGVFDATADPPEQLRHALEMIANGTRYWSPNLIIRMQQHHLGPKSVFRLLTIAEQRVLSIVGDGCDDIVAAGQLGLTPSTVSTIRRELHRKLGVQHRGELVRVAAQNGFVRFTPDGVGRPGYGMLAAALANRGGRRGTIPKTKDRPVDQLPLASPPGSRL